MKKTNSITPEQDVFKHDLTNNKNSYCHYLDQSMNDINAKFSDQTVDANAFRAFVQNAVAEAKDTPAKKNFINTLQRQRSKFDILLFVTNAKLKGQGLGVI